MKTFNVWVDVTVSKCYEIEAMTEEEAEEKAKETSLSDYNFNSCTIVGAEIVEGYTEEVE